MSELRFSFNYEVVDNKTKKRIAFDRFEAAHIDRIRTAVTELANAVEKFELRELGLCPECGSKLIENDILSETYCPGCGYQEAGPARQIAS